MFMDLFLPALCHRIVTYRRKTAISQINRRVYEAREYMDKQTSDASRESRKDIEVVDKRAKLLDQAKSSVWDEALLTRYSTFGDYTRLVTQLGK